MNVKFKMPMFGRHLTVKGSLKELLMTFLGTTISIVLTFGTTALLDNREKAAQQRQTALMSVYDIDEIIRMLKEDMEKEKVLSEVTNYVFTHQEELDSMSSDTLKMAVAYLVEDMTEKPEWADDSKEKAFSGNIEVRQNMKYAQFYDNVRESYRLRRELLGHLEKDIEFSRPVSDTDYHQFVQQLDFTDFDTDGNLTENASRSLLRHAFQQRSTELYLRCFFRRRENYAYYIMYLIRLNRENKFMADITDDDMAEYVKKNVDKTMPVTAQQLIGTWEEQFVDNDVFHYKLKKDQMVEFIYNAVNKLDLYLKDEKMYVPILVPTTTRLKGHWELKGDSLKMNFDNKTLEVLAIDVDFSKLPKSALERSKGQKQRIKDAYIEMYQQKDWTISRKVSFDLSGQILLYEEQEKTLWGTKKTTTNQMVRLETSDK
jgi:hypothetical protein